jgi:hypothetical protein
MKEAHMNLKKSLTIAAAAGALAAISVPAMAFEHDFHGSYKLKYFISNYERGGGGTFANALAPGGNQTENSRTNNYFEQRARLFYTAKASDDLKLVTAFEIDSVFGDRAQGGVTAADSTAAGTGTLAFRGSGGAMESDAVNLETKWVYLDFKIPSTPIRMQAGIMPVKDQLKGILLDADIAGILSTTKIGNYTANLGYFRGYDQSYFGTSNANVRPRGIDNLDVVAFENIYAINKDSKVGMHYYLYNDSRGNYVTYSNPTTSSSGVALHTLGLTGETKIGKVSLSGLFAYQGGLIKNFTPAKGAGTGDTSYLNAFAYNLAAKAPVGPGTLKTSFLFTSGNGTHNAVDGDKRAHYTGWVGTQQSGNNVWAATTATNTFNESGMMLINRNAAAGGTTTDNAIAYNAGFGTTPMNMQGLYLYTFGYDAQITPKLYANMNVGFAWAARTNELKPFDQSGNAGAAYVSGASANRGPNGSTFVGTEINLETGYKMYDNLTASLQAAYVVLGGYYNKALLVNGRAQDPDDPYTVRTVLSYAF